jgi:hypothetical protein
MRERRSARRDHPGCARQWRRAAANRLLLVVFFAAAIAWLASPSALAQDSRGTQEGATAASSSATPGLLTIEQGDAGQGPEARSSRVEGTRPTVGIRRAEASPEIDGRLDDPVWQSAVRITEFVQERPFEGSPATEQTEVSLAYDSQNLYIAVHAQYSDLALMRSNRLDRDQTDNDDTVTVYFDPFLDDQIGYAFSVNGYGVQGDSVLTSRTGGGPPGGSGGGGGPGGGGPSGDKSWDALFRTAAQMVETGWTAEMAIPFKSLRYPSRGPEERHRWGFQVQRQIRSKDETVVWAPVSRNVMGFIRQFGVLEGLQNLSTSRNLEILPTFTAVQAGALNTTSGAFANSDSEDAGVSVKYGLTPNLTFDFTYNPDFSQIESDTQQIQVNLRFPVSFPELRPFFLEGQDIFRIPGPVTMVHTRTIVDPQYGAKLTGKIGKATVGFVFADDQAPGKGDDPLDPAFGQAAQAVMGRVRYDLAAGSHIGGIVTNREFLDSSSRLTGLDTTLRLGRTHRFSAYAVTSARRDLDGVERSGYSLEANLRKEGRNLGYFIAHFQIDPEFGTDLGFVRRTDQKNTTGNISYRWWPETWLINWGPRYNIRRNYAFDGTLQDTENMVTLSALFAKNINVSGNVSRDMERYRDVDFHKTNYMFRGDINTSRKVLLSGQITGGDAILFVENPYLGKSRGMEATVTLRPFSRLQSEIKLDATRFVDVRNDADTEVYDVKIWRALTTYQFTERLLVRNILEHHTFDKTLGANLLLTYRVNAGTAFYIGYDDRHRSGSLIDPILFPTSEYRRTNRAIFTKLQYLLRY